MHYSLGGFVILPGVNLIFSRDTAFLSRAVLANGFGRMKSCQFSGLYKIKLYMFLVCGRCRFKRFDKLQHEGTVNVCGSPGHRERFRIFDSEGHKAEKSIQVREPL